MDLMCDERCPDWHVLHIAPGDGGLKSNTTTVLVSEEQQAVGELIVDDITLED